MFRPVDFPRRRFASFPHRKKHRKRFPFRRFHRCLWKLAFVKMIFCTFVIYFTTNISVRITKVKCRLAQKLFSQRFKAKKNCIFHTKERFVSELERRISQRVFFTAGITGVFPGRNGAGCRRRTVAPGTIFSWRSASGHDVFSAVFRPMTELRLPVIPSGSSRKRIVRDAAPRGTGEFPHLCFPGVLA